MTSDLLMKGISEPDNLETYNNLQIKLRILRGSSKYRTSIYFVVTSYILKNIPSPPLFITEMIHSLEYHVIPQDLMVVLPSIFSLIIERQSFWHTPSRV